MSLRRLTSASLLAYAYTLPLCQLRDQLEAREGFRMREAGKRPRRERRAEAERALDEAIEESFPASDPLASTRTTAGGPDHPPKASRGVRSERRG